MPKIPKEAKMWLESAQEDLGVAADMLQAGRYNYTAFVCQQSLEKLLKGIFVLRKRKPPPYIHDLVKLAEKTEGELPMRISAILAEVSDHYIAARYPEVRPRYDKKTAEHLLTITKEAYQWFTSRLT